MFEQLELDFGEIINHPTPMSKVMLLDPRPHWHTPEVEEKIYLKLAKIIADEETPEEVIEDCRERLDKFDEFNDSYEVSKFLTNTLYCDDEWVFELRNEIEYFCSQAKSILNKKVKEWVDYWNIIPPAQIGEKVMISRYPKTFGFRNAKLSEYLITEIFKNEAKIVAYPIGEKYTEEEALEHKAGYLFPYEHIVEWTKNGI